MTKHHKPDHLIAQLLRSVYAADVAEPLTARVLALIELYRPRLMAAAPERAFFTERDCVVVTYGDMVFRDGELPLVTLGQFLDRHAAGLVNTVHILPFYPYSSDDGFSVIDYLAVNPALGTWREVQQIGSRFKLMVDAVINHVSQHSSWFQAFRRGERPYTDYFVVADPHADLSAVFRPRALPLLTPVQTADGPRHVWSTFSDDQIDLNYASPDLLLEILAVLLQYAVYGARIIRLDAIGFMWKEIGTRCLHLPQTHALIQLMRAVLDQVAPYVALVTETNVPHQENISYFGDGANEAQMVYNFSLPPLTLNAFHTGSARVLSRWAASLTQPSNRVTFFNFLASHDGIGLTPARGLLPETAVAAMADRVLQLGGRVSYRNNPDGSQSPYELNINYLDALAEPGEALPAALVARRFLAAQAIMLALRGVPGIYFHSLFGSRGWPEGVQQTGQPRSINRQKLDVDRLEAALSDPDSLRHHVFTGYRQLLQARSGSAAFHPNGEQEILDLHPGVFSARRTAPDGSERVLCLHNVTRVALPLSLPAGSYLDLLTGQRHDGPEFTLEPFQVAWLRLEA